ncbi:hypothetical protein ACEWH9_14240 [Vibrio diabolicus]|uniref:hypothetical protein n=5 Tax=Vibrio TaxID=662 RepID=UPI0035A83C24
MSNKTEVLMCPTCGVETHHVVVLVRKKSGFEGDKNRNKKEFIAGFLKSVVFGAFLASMDEFERHLICEQNHSTVTDSLSFSA